MRNVLIFFLFFFFLSKVSANVDSLYFLHAKSFIEEVYGGKLKLPRLVLVDQPRMGCDVDFIATNLFTIKEVLAIKEQIKNPKLKSWNTLLKPDKLFITKDSLNNILNKEYLRPYNGWTYFRKFIGSEINHISAPIFLRNYEYCLFYSEYVCEYKCGYGVLKLYKRENNHWIEVTELCSWVS